MTTDTTDTASRLAAIRERADDVATRHARPGYCAGGVITQHSVECRKCAARSDQNCPQSIRDGDQAIEDRADLLALVDRMEERLAIYKSQVEAGAVRIAAAEAQIADAEMSLHTWDHEGHLYCACGRKIPGRPAAQSTPSPGHAEVARGIVAEHREYLASDTGLGLRETTEHGYVGLMARITRALTAAAAQEAEECAKVAEECNAPSALVDFADELGPLVAAYRRMTKPWYADGSPIAWGDDAPVYGITFADVKAAALAAAAAQEAEECAKLVDERYPTRPEIASAIRDRVRRG